MPRIPSAAALGFQGIPAERLYATDYVVLTPHRMIVVEHQSEMLDDVVKLLKTSGEVEITVFERRTPR